MRMNCQSFFVVVLLSCPILLFAQDKSDLSIKTIMQGEKFVGALPENIHWSANSEAIIFSWNPDQEAFRDYYKTVLKNNQFGEPQRIAEELQAQYPIPKGVWDRDHSLKIYSKNGDLFLKDIAQEKTLQITNTLERESEPIFIDGDRKIVYRKGNNLYEWDRNSGATTQLSNFQSREDMAKDTDRDVVDEWLYKDQLANFEVLRSRNEKADASIARSQAREISRPAPIYLNGARLSSINISPDGRYLVYTTVKNPKTEQTMVPDFVTIDGYTQALNAREKVGKPQTIYYTGIYDRQRDSSYALQLEDIPGIYEKPKFLRDYHQKDSTFKSSYEEQRAVIVHGPQFAPKGNAAVVDIKAMNNKDRWLMSLELETGRLFLVDRQHDDAWVGGPGVVSWNMVAGNTGWLPDGKEFWFQSEKTGYSHLYKVDIATKRQQQLTSGEFEVIDAQLSKDGNHFYLTTSEVDPGERHFYKMNVNGGQRTKITSLMGNNEVTLSPDEKWLAIRYSYSNQPWELYVQENKARAKPRRLTHSTTKTFEAYQWRKPELVYFKARDGARVRARLYRPDQAKKGGSAVIFVHGAGYLQNVHKWWSSYYREYMFHNFLVDQGYTVLDIDYRGSKGYGRDWRTGIYRHMGGKDLTDQVDGAAFLAKKYKIDTNRIGIYGGSYGGFISLMAMFKAPKTFKAGAALRSVTDWAHYNHPYTSNILNTPAEDSLAYQRSSPIYFADGLQGHLLMLHGMVDRNVQFQDVVRLSQRLIELEKENWELAVFPMEGHSFKEASSWIDEYRRIYELFEKTLNNKE